MQQGASLIDEPEVCETRDCTRFNLLTSLEAQFAAQPAIVRNLSARGLGLRHAAQVRVGSTASVKVEAPENENATTIRCRVVWSRLSRAVDERGRHLYDSGLFILDDSPAVAGLLGRLIRAYGVRDSDSLEAKRRMLESRAKERANGPTPTRVTPASIPRITPDQVVLIREAQELLATNHEAAAKLHERAKQSLLELGLIGPNAKSLPYRREVLVVWAYLEGRLDLDLISMILNLPVA